MAISRGTLLRNPPDHVQQEDMPVWVEAVDRALGVYLCEDCPRCKACRYARWAVRLHRVKLWLLGYRD